VPVFQLDYHTETAGTVIEEIVPPKENMIARITGIIYEAAATAHTLTVMRAVANTSCSKYSASGQTVLNVLQPDAMKDSAGADEALAANDFVVYQTEDGTYGASKVSSVSGNAITMTANLAGTVDEGGTIWLMGELARTTHVAMNAKASTVNILEGLAIQAGLPQQASPKNIRDGANDPLLIQSDNATNAGFLRSISGVYAAVSDITTT